MDPALLLALLSWSLTNAPAVADFVKRHTEAGTTPTPEEAKVIIEAAQAGSDAVNDDWLKS